MKLIRSLILFPLLLAFACGAALSYELADSVVAKVDEEVVLLSDLKAEAAILRLGGEAILPPLRVLVRDIIKRRLLVSQALKLRMEVKAEDVKEEVAALTGEGSEAETFWRTMKRLGIGEKEVERRVGEMALARNYTQLKRRSIYVAESDVRAFYAENREALGHSTLSEARDEIRDFLASKKYQAELSVWYETQVKLGRVRLSELDPALTVE